MLNSALTFRWLFVTVSLLVLGQVTPAVADDVHDCEQGAGPEVQIQGCTNLIMSGDLIGDSLAAAHFNRGNAYGFMGDFDHAIADYSEAIQIKPDFALAYGNRALAYRVKGEPDRAKPDCDIATGLDPDTNC